LNCLIVELFNCIDAS